MSSSSSGNPGNSGDTSHIAVVGFGSPLMKDEGIGVYLLERLRERASDFPGCEFHDLGTAGARILHVLPGRDKAVIIDCAFMGEAAGTIRRFVPGEAASRKDPGGFSLHQGDLLQNIEVSRALGELPPEIVIFGIQPEDVAEGQELSPILSRRIDEYIELIEEELL